MKNFIKIAKMSQGKLKKYLKDKLKAVYDKVICEDGFLYAKGDVHILLTAHLDTVHRNLPKTISQEIKKGKTILSSPQGIGGDDRCGVWIILEILKKGYLPSVLFCEDEEIGGVGSSKFCKKSYIENLQGLNYFIELDRKGNEDAVFYDCGNREFKKYISDKTGYKEAHGSFSDISHLSPSSDIASVNLSCGYYNPHTLSEFVVMEEMQQTADKVIELLQDKTKQYKYEEEVAYYEGYGFYENNILFVSAMDKKGNYFESTYQAETEGLAWCDFFFEHPDISISGILDYDWIEERER